ncbi:MAG: ribosome small subunit-dependent GTPase A [Elusimicrobia bacterium GWF2_52_66]|nr:MAG: ribosome small subunit-dependent GTPase A [Elusimicrobia bacterium GWA2_51_34]OGR84942.1 MAG: ribosome small subunit-dependent GTPase A [Elusimicrobia bacterium GWF2_52_66]HAF96340.1 ribosome small subunit-dependent GTPase A [Elusimicrobiota bacterium]HCE98526.1 ribosome small subunit-dependent GTPase A [Elusimicrobiota bacterium]
MELKDLGYNSFFETHRNRLGLDGYSVARVIAEYKETYRVKNENGEFPAKITGKQMHQAKSREDYPAVGDWVAISELEVNWAVIYGVLPRKSLLKRKTSGKFSIQVIATNIDVAFAIESMDRDYNLNRFERYCALAKDGGIEPSIILNKTDLISAAELEEKTAQIRKRFKNVEIFTTSVTSDHGIAELRSRISQTKTYCFLGSSGVGKSSLINKLLGSNATKIKAIGELTGRGKHTTTTREMYFLNNGGIIIDNPGLREVGMADSIIGIDTVFDGISTLSEKCRFKDCTHTHEPGCAVKVSVETGELDENRFSNYLKLKKEAGYYQMTKNERRKKDHQFGKFVKKALEQIKKYKSP